MCTLSVIPLDSDRSYRLAFNRDEQRTRQEALPPAIEQFGDRHAMLPRDPAGGTWIGCNDAGVTFGLLNYNPDVRRDPPSPAPRPEVAWPPLSRGLIIPELLSSPNTPAAVASAARLIRPETYSPFRLLIIDGQTTATLTSDGRRLSVVENIWERTPFMLTSSSLGDSVVTHDREALFQDLILRPELEELELARAQDKFHAHHWPDRSAISVWMSRSDALTVSQTVIEVSEAGVRMWYQPARTASKTLSEFRLDPDTFIPAKGVGGRES